MEDYGTQNKITKDNVFEVRQTDRKVGADLERNILGLIERGITPSSMDVRYVKLCHYENQEEDLKTAYSDIFDEMDNDENYID